MKFLLSLSIMMTTVLTMTSCSNTDWADLIEPRSGNNDKRVQQRPRPFIRPQSQRRVVYVPPRAKTVPVKTHRRTPDCSYIVRDLSKPNSSTIWCYPAGTR